MISILAVEPGVSRALYTLIRLTSDFVVGHAEVVFFETDDGICIRAARNIVRSDLQRLGRKRLASNFVLGTDADEARVVRALASAFRPHGVQTRLERPDDCIALAVTSSLIAPARAERSVDALRKRHGRLAVLSGLPLSDPSARIEHASAS